MASGTNEMYLEKYDKIKAMRWPDERRDNRLKGANYFWFTVRSDVGCSVSASNTDDFEVVRTLSNKKKYYLSEWQRKEMNVDDQDPYVELKEKLWKESLRVKLFQERASEVYGLVAEEILPVYFTDELGNTFFAALNENTTDTDELYARIQRFNERTREIGMSNEAALRAVVSTEIFSILINQVWEAVGLKNEQYLLKMVEAIAICMSFIEMSGLLHDPVFITMSGHLDSTEQDMFKKMKEVLREYSYSNHYMRFDAYFNENHVPENWSMEYTEEFKMTLALFFNDSCIYSPENPDDAWRQAIPYLSFHLVDCTEHSIVRNRMLLSAFTLFTLTVCEQEMFNHSVVPNELGNVYVIFDGTTPAHRTSYILTTAASLAEEFLNDPRHQDLTRLINTVMDFKVPGYFRES